MTGGAALSVRVGCTFTWRLAAPVPAVLRVQPRDVASVLWETVTVHPEVPVRTGQDGLGNRLLRLVLPPGDVVLTYEAVVSVPAEADPVDRSAEQLAPEELPDELLAYTLPSRYCLSDVLADVAYQQFGLLPPGFDRVQAISDWVHERVTFTEGASNPLTTAADVLGSGQGVCRDFAHLGVTMCRALNIPTRYACGYLPDIDVPAPDSPMDFCGWLEVFLGNRWWTFDPRNNAPRIGRSVIAYGRDAVDVPMVSTFGDAPLVSMTVVADEEPSYAPSC